MSHFADLKKRFFLSVVILSVIFLLLYFAENLIASFFLLALVCALSFLGMKEYLFLTQAKQIELPKTFLLICSLLVPAAFFVEAKFFLFPAFPFVVLFVCLLRCFFSSFRKIDQAICRVSESIMGIIYLTLPMGMILSILFKSPNGTFWVLFVLIITKVTDIAAYFVGRLWGKKPLAIHLSPKKTWAGAIGGWAFGTMAGGIMALANDMSCCTIIQLVILAAILSILGQVGDLAESLLKRDAGVKDSSIIPGMGGVLDMIDSLLFTIPVVYFNAVILI